VPLIFIDGDGSYGGDIEEGKKKMTIQKLRRKRVRQRLQYHCCMSYHQGCWVQVLLHSNLEQIQHVSHLVFRDLSANVDYFLSDHDTPGEECTKNNSEDSCFWAGDTRPAHALPAREKV